LVSTALTNDAAVGVRRGGGLDGAGLFGRDASQPGGPRPCVAHLADLLPAAFVAASCW
jgi:hypothetical protein